MELEQFLGIIRNMSETGRVFKPHRYLTLMAIIDIIETQEKPQNRFYYDDIYKEYFTNWFEEYHGRDDRYNPTAPFFYLKNAGSNVGGFWFLSPKPGKESDLNSLKRIDGPGQLDKIVEYAYLDKKIFELLREQQSREILRNEIKRCLIAGLQTKKKY